MQRAKVIVICGKTKIMTVFCELKDLMSPSGKEYRLGIIPKLARGSKSHGLNG